MRNTFKCQHGLDKILSFSSFGRVIITTSKMNCFTVSVLLVCLSFTATGIPLEEGPVGGRGSFSFNRTILGLPTFLEGPTEGRPRPGSIRSPSPRINTTEEVINSTAQNSGEIFEIQHSGGNSPPPAPNNSTNREGRNAQAKITTDASGGENTDTTDEPSVFSDLTTGYQEIQTTGTFELRGPSTQALNDINSEHLTYHTTTDTSIRNQYINQAITTETPERRKTDFYAAEMSSHQVTPENELLTINAATEFVSSGRQESTTVVATENIHPESYTTSNALAESSIQGQYPSITEPVEEASTMQITEKLDSSDEIETPPAVTQAPEHSSIGSNRQENEILGLMLERLGSIEQNYKDLEKQMRQSQISMSHEILLLKEALALEQNRTKHIALQMTHMMEAINDRLINITQKWTHPLLDLTNYPTGAQGCRYSSFHRSGSVTENSTSTAWAPNDTEAELYMVTGAACSASIGARGYLERRTVPSKPELMQFSCTCTESRQSAVMRTCELHIWECFR